jgi:fucose 4-O-acetylase-like acetyltransferase
MRNNFDKKFNKEMNLFKMIGIIHVVTSHIYSQLFSMIRQSYAFHMPLFYFASGYFYDENYEYKKIKYVLSKFKKNIVLFYFYYFIFFLFAFLFYLKYKIFFWNFSFDKLFIQPFTSGSIGFWLEPAWFIFSLFLVQTSFVFIYPKIKIILKNNFLQLLFFIFLALISIYLNNSGWNKNQFLLMITRTLLGMSFYYLGFFYKKNIENKINIFNGFLIFFNLITISILNIIFGVDLLFNMRMGIYSNNVYLPLLSSLIGIYLSLLLAKGLNKIIKNENDLFHLIGRNTYYIMIFHFFCFFIISFIFFKINNVSDIYLIKLFVWTFAPSDIININVFWPIYVCFGVLIPTFYGELINKIKNNK